MKKTSHRKPNRPHNARQTRAQRPCTTQAEAKQGAGYLGRLMAAARSGGLVKPGEVTHVTVDHSPACRAYVGPCICLPEISAVTGDGRLLSIDHDGEAVAVRPT